MGRITAAGLAVVILLSLSSMGTAATHYVPENFATIQAALDKAVAGDIVIVRDGVYAGAGNKNLDFKGKAITLRSANGPSRCVIDCEGEGTGVNFFANASPSDQILEGISIVNAWETAIYSDGAHIQVHDCIISGNSAYQGGGISLFNSSAVIEGCIVSENAAFLHGGGIYCFESTVKLRNSRISGNNAQVGGGGILSFSSSADVKNCVISGNQGYDYGGGFSSNYSSAAFINCTIKDNTTYGVGGGLDIFDSPATSLTNCAVVNNKAPSAEGGGIYLFNSLSVIVRNCTFSGNSAAWYSGGGGGIYAGSSQAELTNSILWNDLVGVGLGPEIALANESSFTVSYCDVQGGQAAVYVDPGCTLTWGPGNIDADPLFVAGPGGNYYLSQVAAGQSANSPCVDRGNRQVIGLAPTPFRTTRTDLATDRGTLDLGYHYRKNQKV